MTALVERLAAMVERLLTVTAWTMVLILAAYIVLTGLHVGHESWLFAADERLARAIASPFKVFDGVGLGHSWW